MNQSGEGSHVSVLASLVQIRFLRSFSSCSNDRGFGFPSTLAVVKSRLVIGKARAPAEWLLVET